MHVPPKTENSFSNETSKTAVASFVRFSLLSVFVYAVLAVSYAFPVVNVNKLVYNVITCTASTALIWSYWSQYKLVQQHKIDLKLIAGLAMVASVVALAIPTFFSEDIFCYINTGWIQYHCHQNPYVNLIAHAPGFGTDPMFTNVWALNPCPYGFVFAHLAKILCAIGNGNMALTIALFKAINWLAYIALATIVWFGAKRLKLRAELSTLLFMWNPLLLVHSLSNAHNDMLMPLFVMLGYLCAFSGPVALAIPALVVGALVKYLWALAIPFTVVFLVRTRGWRTAAVSTLLGAATFAALSSTYLADWQAFRWDQILLNINQNCNSLLATVHHLLDAINRFAFRRAEWWHSASNSILQGVRLVLIGGFGGIVIWLFGKSVLKSNYLTPKKLIEITVLATMLMVCVVSGKFYSWYQLMFFPVALWLPETSKLRNLIVVLSCTQLFGMTFIGKAHIANYLILTAIPMIWALNSWVGSKRLARAGNALSAGDAGSLGSAGNALSAGDAGSLGSAANAESAGSAAPEKELPLLEVAYNGRTPGGNNV